MPTNFTLNFLTVTKRIFCSRSLQLATIELIRRKAVLQMTDKTDQIKGKVQETVGKVTDDQQLEAKGFASNNVVFGIGSYTYNYLTRDTFGFAVKATRGQVNGQARELFKDPITDSGVKKSAKGLLRVEKSKDGFVLFDQQTAEQEQQGALKTVFENGQLLRECSLDEIRERLTINL